MIQISHDSQLRKKMLNFLSVLFWHFVDFHSMIQGKKRKLLKYKKKCLKDVKQKMIDFANCHLPGFEFPFCLLVVLLRAFSMRNGSATCVYMLRCYCLQLLSNAVEVFSKSVDSTKRRRTRKHANSCSSSKRGNAYCGFATGIMVKFLFSPYFYTIEKVKLCGLLLLSSVFWTKPCTPILGKCAFYAFSGTVKGALLIKL